MNRINNLAIIQARIGSSRLPGKVLLDLCGAPVLEHVVNRVKKSILVDEIIVATTMEKQDLPIVSFCAEKGIRVFCGSENDVLERYYQAAKLIKPRNVIRITADCPLMDPEVIDLVIQEHMKGNYDYTSNILNETYPDGEDVEVMKYCTLEEAWKKADLASQREHVTQFIIKNDQFNKHNVEHTTDLSDKRWTLDEYNDFLFISEIYKNLYVKDNFFNMYKILEFLNKNPELENMNRDTLRNEGLIKSLKNDQIV